MNSRSKNNKDLILLFGPTASGKTSLLFYLQDFFKTQLNKEIEVISADSMQVYRGLDIGTAKPSRTERDQLPHWLIDIADPDQQFDLGDFMCQAESSVKDILSRNAIPVISGGTGFYFKHFLTGLPATPPVPADIRIMVEDLAITHGNQILKTILTKVDPVSANRIHVNDRYRLCRALEVYYSSGQALSSYKPPVHYRAEYNLAILGLTMPRQDLYLKINTRVDNMFDEGLIQEVQNLFDQGYGPQSPGMRGIGYKEFFNNGVMDTSTPDKIKENIKTNTRRYAKRQITYFKTMHNVCWFNPQQQLEISRYLLSFTS